MFTDADFVRDHVRALAGSRTPAGSAVTAVVLDAETVPSVDVTAAAMLAQLDHELAAGGVRFGIAKGIGQVRDVLASSGTADVPTIYPTVDAAVADLGPGART